MLKGLRPRTRLNSTLLDNAGNKIVTREVEFHGTTGEGVARLVAESKRGLTHGGTMPEHDVVVFQEHQTHKGPRFDIVAHQPTREGMLHLTRTRRKKLLPHGA
jgi:hypothetical protein